MCLTSRIREPQDVMSTDDPSLAAAPQTQSHSTSPVPDIKNASLTTSTPHSAKDEKTGSRIAREHDSDLSLPVSESTESELNVKMKSEDTVSMESVEGGELKKENAQSAFAFLSVIPGTESDELENSGNPRQPVSLDDSIQMKLTESEEDSVSLSEEQRLTASSTEQDHTTSAPKAESPIVTTDGRTTSVSQSQPLTSSANLSSSSSSTDTSKVSPVPLQAGGGPYTGAAPSNGPSMPPGQSRFRRVNQYNRGRWKVRDTETTEERADSDPLKGLLPNSSAFSSPSSKRRSEDGLHSRSASELGQLSDIVSDKDSASVPLDRSSTAAEGTISRNTSLSSITAEKSVDGDLEGLSDLNDTESTGAGGTLNAGGGGVGGTSTSMLSGKEREIVDVIPPSSVSTTLQHDAESITGGFGPQEQNNISATTAAVVPPHHQGAVLHPPNGPTEPSDSESVERQATKEPLDQLPTKILEPGPQKIRKAMSYLQTELQSLLESNTTVEQRNQQLQEKNDELSEKYQKLLDENFRLKQELERLKAAQPEKR